MTPSERRRLGGSELVLDLRTEGHLTPNSRVGDALGGRTDRQVTERRAGLTVSMCQELTDSLQDQTLSGFSGLFLN